jgi:hypothetical protein
MKTRPILFSGPMVQAILADRKSQTRRVIKPQPQLSQDGKIDWVVNGQWRGAWAPGVGGNMTCPYGAVGDHLYVKETFAIAEPGVMARNDSGGPIYAADYPLHTKTGFGPWKSGRFMPRAVSRITLELTAVRCERLQSISEIDCEAELGARPYSLGNDAYSQFHSLWDSINGKTHPWTDNPWCWCLSFRVADRRDAATEE